MAGTPGSLLPGVLPPNWVHLVGVYGQTHTSNTPSEPPPPPPHPTPHHTTPQHPTPHHTTPHHTTPHHTTPHHTTPHHTTPHHTTPHHTTPHHTTPHHTTPHHTTPHHTPSFLPPLPSSHTHTLLAASAGQMCRHREGSVRHPCCVCWADVSATCKKGSVRHPCCVCWADVSATYKRGFSEASLLRLLGRCVGNVQERVQQGILAASARQLCRRRASESRHPCGYAGQTSR